MGTEVADNSTSLNQTPENGPLADQTTPARRRGGQAGNANAMRHGLRSYQLRVGTPPAGYTQARKGTTALRKLLEAELLARDGEIKLLAAATVSTVLTHELRRAVLSKVMREKWATLDLQEQLALSREIGAAADKRDAALRLLDLDAGDQPLDLAEMKRRHYATMDAQAAMPRHVAQIEPGSDATAPSTERASTSQATPQATTGALNGASTEVESERDED